MSEQPSGQDTPTGTDPDAKYETPGYEDKSFGQAVDQDAELADRLAHEEPDERDAAELYEERATGAPARERQGRPETAPPESASPDTASEE